MVTKKTAAHAKLENKSSSIKGGGHGGKREGAGRPRGAHNKVTIELGAAAREHTATALGTLLEICKKGQSEAARVAAATALLDRGFGRPRQALDVSSDGTVVLTVTAARDNLMRKLDRICSTSEASSAAIEHGQISGKPH